MAALALVYSLQLSSGENEHYVRSTTSSVCALLQSQWVCKERRPVLHFYHILGRWALSWCSTNTLSGGDTAVVIIIHHHVWYFMYQLALRSLEIWHSGMDSLSNTVLFFTDTHSVHISDVKFNHEDQSRALSFTQSTATITNCCFSNGHSENEGAININSSSIAFYGSNFFENNTADFSGGAVFADDTVRSWESEPVWLIFPQSTLLVEVHSQTVIEFQGFSNFTENQPTDAGYSLLGGAIMVVKKSSLDIQNSTLLGIRSYLGAALFSANSFREEWSSPIILQFLKEVAYFFKHVLP